MDPADFIGNLVHLKAASGAFQGVITCIDTANQTITLKDPLQYGRPMPISEVTILATDIEDLRFVQNEAAVAAEEEEEVVTNNSHQPTTVTPPPTDNNSHHYDVTPQHSAKKDGRPKAVGHSYREQRQQRGSHRSSGTDKRRNKSSTTDWLNLDIQDYAEDYDFQSNNLKFDKSAFYEEVNYAGSEGETRTPKKQNHRSHYYKSEAKYGHDEMILETQPVTYRQIKLANGSGDDCEYYTDNGLVIPCISSATRDQLCQVADSMGFSYSRQIEAFGINTSQMLLSLLGGPNRLRPLNAHQLPHVVILTGTGMVGIRGLALGRHLANQNLEVTVLVTPDVTSKFEKQYREEMKLMSFTSVKLINDPKHLPDSPVDLVVTAVDNDEHMNMHAVRWCSFTNAPILCISPSTLIDEKRTDVKTKWSICAVLPPSYEETSPNSSIYLVDIGFTSHIFQQLSIKYKSPFCGKTFIPLHSSR